MPFDMRLSEAITIYLAVSASFGAYNFLCERNPENHLHILLKSTRAALLWPLAAAKILFSRWRSDKGVSTGSANDEADAQFIEQIEDARRKLMASLYKIVELAQTTSGMENAIAERSSRAVRETVEKYTGLTLAAAEIDVDALPSGRELELFRVAGRRGDDLLLAGRCIRRRNSSRLITHQARARTELLHALAEIREFGDCASALTNNSDARHLSVETVRFYGHAFNFLSLLEDETAARSVARLLDAECVRLKRLESLSQKEEITEEELCTAHASHSILTAQSQTRALNQG
jgi:hypothetical protein